MAESFYVQALYAYSGVDTSSLSFQQGDIIEVLSTLASGWWDGVICEQKIRGWFPSNYVQRISDDEAQWAREEMSNWWEGSPEDNEPSDGEQSHPGGLMLNGAAIDSPNRAMNELIHGNDDQNYTHPDATGGSDGSLSRPPTTQHRTTKSQSSAYSHSQSQEEDYWVPRVTHSGQLFYYNTRTAETSRDMPLDGQGDGVVIPPSEFAQDELDSVDIVIARPRDSTAALDAAAQLRRASVYSDDSALDVDLSDEARPPPRRIESPREAVLTADALSIVTNSLLLSLSPPPLVVDLESDVSDSLQALINCVGTGELRSPIPSDAAKQRDQLAAFGDSVVLAVRTLLHASGVLDNPGLEMPSTTNEIIGPFDHTLTLPSFALVELRPHTRRVTSNLSKLVLSIRAVWGLLETIAADQALDTNNSTEGATAEEDAEFARTNETKNYEFAAVREARLSTEAKLRSEVLAGARDVQVHVHSFLTEFERHLSTLSGVAASDRTILRMPKRKHGAFTTTRAALMLPGAGYGGNWRGHGFVELPSSHTTTNLESLMSAAAISEETGIAALSYAYPSTPLSSDVAKSLLADSLELLNDSESLKTAVSGIASFGANNSSHSRTISSSSNASFRMRPLSNRSEAISSTQLLNLSSKLIGRLSDFLGRVEDVDVAASVDVELSKPKVASEPADLTAEYLKSVDDARTLLFELDIAKQQVYEIAPSLLAAVQECFTIHPAALTSTTPMVANPLATSPLAFAQAAGRVEYGPETILEVLAELRVAVERLSRTFNALARITEIQSATPDALRQKSSAARPIRANDATIRASRSIQQHSSDGMVSSRQSLAHTFDEEPDSPMNQSRNRESSDSDFFFPADSPRQSNVASPPLTPSSTTGKSRSSKTSAMFSAIGGGWDRRESNATTASGMSDGLPFRKDLPSRDDLNSPVRSPSKIKLAKLLGSADPAASPMRSTASLPENVPVWLGPDYGPDEISFNMEGQVKGGTMRALIIAAASHEGRVDSNYLSTLLMTYRTFCTSHQLLDLLVQRFQVEAPMGLVLEDMKIWETRKLRPIRARVANVLKSWVREHMDYDEFDPELLRRIADFATTTMRDPVQSPQIIKAVEERLKGAGPRTIGSIAPGPLPPSIIPRGFRKLKFIDIEPLELARQLTIMDGRLFSRITPQECLGKAWPKEYGSDAPNISAMIDMSNGITRWVTETILAHDDAKKRANIIKHFIAVAERCLALNNFSTLIHIIAGLNSTPVHRLRRTWETLSQKSMVTLATLNKAMRPDKNYKDYRETLRGVAPPCVPFLGVYLTDWTFIGDGNPDMVREKPHLINFQKRQKASELILMIKLHQSTTYNLAAVPVLIKYLEEQLFSSEPIDQASEDQRLYEISLLREPREREDERISRLLSESGFL